VDYESVLGPEVVEPYCPPEWNSPGIAQSIGEHSIVSCGRIYPPLIGERENWTDEGGEMTLPGSRDGDLVHRGVYGFCGVTLKCC
jgi:hypothetical protein